MWNQRRPKTTKSRTSAATPPGPPSATGSTATGRGTSGRAPPGCSTRSLRSVLRRDPGKRSIDRVSAGPRPLRSYFWCPKSNPPCSALFLSRRNRPVHYGHVNGPYHHVELDIGVGLDFDYKATFGPEEGGVRPRTVGLLQKNENGCSEPAEDRVALRSGVDHF